MWPGDGTDSFLSMETAENGKVMAFDVEQTAGSADLWAGSRTFLLSGRSKAISAVGADLQIGDNLRGIWAWVTGTVAGTVGVVVVSVATIAYTAKCAKDALWDAYDCTPGTIACRCNGCTGC